MPPVGYGYCQCGCGKQTGRTGRSRNRARYIEGHQPNRTRPLYTVVEAGFSTPCWLWARYLDKGGYGRVKRDGRGQPAHRWFYEARFGAIPEGLELDHLCKNRACVNPEHLEPVTRTENIRRSAQTLLTAEVAQAIRDAPRTYGSRQELAERFGVSPTVIDDIRGGRSW